MLAVIVAVLRESRGRDGNGKPGEVQAFIDGDPSCKVVAIMQATIANIRSKAP
jgi:hypothetical protein